MENEKAVVYGEKQALEQERSGIREELVRVEQEKMDLDTEKAGKSAILGWYNPTWTRRRPVSWRYWAGTIPPGHGEGR